MKRIAVVVLCLLLLLPLAACRETLPEDQPEDYTEVIALYQKVIGVCAWYQEDADYEAYAKELGLSGAEKQLFEKLFYPAYLNYPGRGREDHASLAHRLACGYAIKDLNGDGVDEFVLMQQDYTVVAVLSMKDNKPVVLDCYRPRSTGWIDGDGLLHKCGSNSSDQHVDAVYRIASGSHALELIVEYGTLGHKLVDGESVQQYYKLDGELAMNITKEEYDALCTQWQYRQSSGSAVTKEHSGLQFTPLYDELISKERALEIANGYWSHYQIEQNGYKVSPASDEQAPDSVYVIRIVWPLLGGEDSAYDTIWIDKTTGQTIIPTRDEAEG